MLSIEVSGRKSRSGLVFWIGTGSSIRCFLDIIDVAVLLWYLARMQEKAGFGLGTFDEFVELERPNLTFVIHEIHVHLIAGSTTTWLWSNGFPNRTHHSGVVWGAINKPRTSDR